MNSYFLNVKNGNRTVVVTIIIFSKKLEKDHVTKINITTFEDMTEIQNLNMANLNRSLIPSQN